MDVSTIKTASWFLSATLSLGLGYTVWDYLDRDSGRRVANEDGTESLVVVDPEYVRSILESDMRPELDVKHGLTYKDQVERTFLLMNWTGYEAPPPAVAAVESTAPQGPRYRPLDRVLRVQLLVVDPLDAGGSRAFVAYLPEDKAAVLRVGDELPKPNNFAVVHAIRTDGIEFAFKQEGRPNEIVEPPMVDQQSLIQKVGAGGPVTAARREIPQAKRRSRTPAQTLEIGNNNFRLGTEDMAYFGENYAAILTSDLRTETHYDKDGRRAGIKVTSVKAGSIASRHGVQAGDVLVSINGNPVSSEHEAINFVKNNQDQYSVWEVVVLRFGQPQTLIYTSPGS